MKKDRIMEMAELGVFGILLLFLHGMVGLDTQDDLFFREVIHEFGSVGEFVANRYQTWSSRVLIEAALVTVLQWNDWIWRIVDTLMILLAVFAITEMSLPEGKRKYCFLTCLAIFMIPVSQIHSAGYGATTLNYVWPLGCGLFAIIPLGKAIRNEKCEKTFYVFGILLSVYAANLEQMAAILLGISGYVVMERLVRKQKVSLYAVLILLISLGMVVFALTCPGNDIRAELEILDFPEYGNYSLPEKIELGFLSIIAYYFGIVEENISILFLLLAAIAVVVAQKKWKILLLLLPAVTAFSYYRCIVEGILKTKKEEKTITLLQNIYPSEYSAYSRGYVLAEVLLGMVILITFVLAIFLLNGKRRKAHLCNLILLAGFLSRMLVSFSSSVIKSGYRTMMFCTVATILVGMILIEPVLPVGNRQGK